MLDTGDDMDSIYEMGMLLDFYGQMLTPRQYEIMDMHFNNDYSLGEIAEHLGISRQGVFDNIKRGKAVLSVYEEKLGLVEKFSRQKAKAQEILDIIKGIDEDKFDEDIKESLSGIEKSVRDIINNI